MKTTIAAVVIALFALGIGIAWATGQFDEDPEFKEAKEVQEKLQETLATATEEQDETTHEERRELFEELREKTEKLPEEQKDAIRDGMMKFFMARMEKRVDDFFALPPEERTAALDEHIDEMEERRQQWEQRRRERDEQRAAAAPAGDNTAESGGGNPAASVNSGAAGASGNAQPAADGQRGEGRGGRGFGPPGRGNRTDEQREQWRRSMLDRTTPETRAKFTEFRRLVDERREERGLPAGPFGRRP